MNNRFNPNGIPDYLKNRQQWVVWGKRSAQGIDALQKDGCLNKIPFNPRTGKAASSNKPNTWASFSDAINAYQSGWYNGVGYMFAEGDGLVGTDLDHCLDATGTPNPQTQNILSHFGNTFTEISPSGDGLHILCFGLALHCGKGQRNKWIEIYGKDIHGKRSNRYFCVTGNQFGKSLEITDGQAALAWLHNTFKAQTTTDSPLEKYVRTAFEDEISKVRNAILGSRNDQLFKSAAALKELCNSNWASPYISEYQVEAALLTATNLPEKEALATIASAFKTATGAREKPKNNTPFVSKRTTTPTFHQTDLGNAERLVARHGENICYCYHQKSWYVWNGIKWECDKSGAVPLLAKETVRSILIDASNPALEKKEAKALAAYAFKCESLTKLNAMVQVAQCEVSVSPIDFDAHPMLLNCANGTLDLMMGKFYQHQREELHSKVIPIHYDKKAQCPIWLKYLDRIFTGNTELIGFIQRALGYSLTGSIEEQCIFLMTGKGQNGKSTFLDTLKRLWGDYGIQAAPDLLLAKSRAQHPTELADLKGARLVTSVETDKNRRLNENLVKQLTGDATLKARFMRQDFFEFKQEHKIWLATNHLPQVLGNDFAIWRRLPVINFDVTISDAEKDPRLLDKLTTELPGIFAWVVEGCLVWQGGGLEKPQCVIQATEAYRAEQDVLSAFFKDCCVIDPRAQVNGTELYKLYVEWCKENGEVFVESSRAFKKLLDERGFGEGRTMKGRFRTGIGLITQKSITYN
jgi:putative DNA primase/helicase